MNETQSEPLTVDELAKFLRRRADTQASIYSLPDPEEVKQLQALLPRYRVTPLTEAEFEEYSALTVKRKEYERKANGGDAVAFVKHNRLLGLEGRHTGAYMARRAAANAAKVQRVTAERQEEQRRAQLVTARKDG